MNAEELNVTLPPGGLKPGPWRNDLTQLMNPDDARTVRARLPARLYTGPGYLSTGLAVALGLGSLAGGPTRSIMIGLSVFAAAFCTFAVIAYTRASSRSCNQHALKAAREAILRARGVI